MRFAVTAVLVLLAGCEAYVPPPNDKCLRRALFQACLSAVPAGPTSTVASNDWDEVVDACDAAAYRQSFNDAKFIKPECK